jgi:hypothetical protein
MGPPWIFREGEYHSLRALVKVFSFDRQFRSLSTAMVSAAAPRQAELNLMVSELQLFQARTPTAETARWRRAVSVSHC